MNYVRDYYNNIELPDGPLGFSHVHESQIINILVKFDTNKAAGIDGLSGTLTVPKYCLTPLLIS